MDKHCGKPMIGIEYRYTEHDYDGISEKRCSVCGKRFGRWTGKELKGDELEPVYGIPNRVQNDKKSNKNT